MSWWGIVLIVCAAASVLVLLTALVCFLIACYSPSRKPIATDEFPLPGGAVYAPYHAQMREWMQAAREMPHEDIAITAFDGLTLRGKFYEYEKDAPIELLMPGYRGTAERDLSGGIFRCFSMGHSA